MDNEIIDISMDFENLENSFDTSGKTNFGGGIELLMNDKKTVNTQNSDIDITDLNNLENELNDLANDNTAPSANFETNFFGVQSNYEDKPSVSFDERPSVGKSTFESSNDEKTWDGYGKFNNIPINPDIHMSHEPKLSKEDLLREKFRFLRKLEALEKKGVELTKKYNMDSNLAEMQGEYEMIMEEKTRQNSVKFQGNMMMAMINGVEFLNNRFDPFDIKIDGWGEQINENITDYDDIFGELYEKYKSKATLAPELKLLFQLGGSAMMVHMTNTMFKSAMPGMDDILRQNPDLMKQFQSAAVNSMSDTSPGLSGFMGGMMNPEPSNQSGRGPPPPHATQGPNAVPLPRDRAGNNMPRPDVSMARGNFNDDGISIKENFGIQGFTPPQPSQKSSRPEMKGPSDISDILSGLKTKTINISETDTNDNNSSTISINDLKELQSAGNVPKRTKRKPKSDKNTVSLDI